MAIHPTAVVDPCAVVDPTASIGAHAVISGPVHIGPGCYVASAAAIMGNTEIGAECRIHSHAVIGDVPQDHAYENAESYCVVGKRCMIREGVTIHRGTSAGSRTVVGNDCFLMTNAHVAHNCEIGEGVTMASGALLGGYVRVGASAVISGNTAVHQFVRIGELAMICGLARVTQDVPPFFMTDREGAVVAENRVGMIRARLSPDERREIKAAFRVIYRSRIGHSDALAYLRSILVTPAGLTLLDFVSATSSRGVARGSLRIRRAA
jgi:UDP-N-acetylglucosamine acyltransferase